VVSSEKKPGDLFVRFFVVKKKQALLTEEIKTATFANCLISKMNL